ncbi:Mucin-associated surface protein (MASP) subgroup S016 [Trypanosoma cruzi]|uniref:Mucin-associated surface protein (MASP) subgroup S016 n=1 Tax=Trypanosoma cruzi TaxID=5693 RepID=A0A7J6XN34_TRYCR|nr:Mucin-associated surface protein (MASP) subgroup S016 [Trypanosoma cruzi]
MAMMMTGRVLLLVCALCVLWCGAGGGYAWPYKECEGDDKSCFNHSQYKSVYNSSIRSRYLGETDLTSTGLFDSSTGSTGNGGDVSRNGADGTTNSVTDSHKGGTQSSLTPSQHASASSGDSSRSKESSEKTEETPGPASTSDNDGDGSPNTANQAHLTGDEKLDSGHQTEDGDTDPNLPLGDSKDGEGTHSSPTPPPANKANVPKVTAEGEKAPAVLTGQEESEGNPEAEPENEQRSSSNGVSVPQPEAAQQGETEDDNTMEKTPDEAAALKNGTATPVDSDGSTAASHTTSPLLLLLLVACAAAAAVVAA